MAAPYEIWLQTVLCFFEEKKFENVDSAPYPRTYM